MFFSFGVAQDCRVALTHFLMASERMSGLIQSKPERAALTFAILFVLESFVRSLNATVLSVQAYELLGSARSVGILATSVSLAVLATTLLSPTIFGLLRRRWVYSIGIVAALLAAISLGSYTIAGQVAGTYLRNAGASLLNITLSLYILDSIKKSDLTKSEPLRMTLSTLSWAVGPALGIWLHEHYGPWGTQIVVLASGLVLLLVFWRLRLREADTFVPGTLKEANPVNHIMRFAEQPRLRLAWLIAFGRSCFWATFFTYGPLLFVKAGESKQFAGLVISASQLMLFLSIIFGKVSQRYGVRQVITVCLAVSGLFAFSVVLAGQSHPYVTATLLLAGAVFCTGLDAVGGIPFLRAVRSSERQHMTAVYRTFIELSELLPGIIYAIALSFFDVPIVFSLLGALMFVIAGVSWQFLPKSM
jgi:MFS family permease